MYEDKSLEDLVARLFDSDADNELPLYEKKGYFLTREALERDHEKIIETIAAIANYGRGVGIIFFSGRGNAGDLVDPELLDSKARAVIGPAVRITLERKTVGSRVVDIITIPPSALRPHIVLDRKSGRFYFPLRGAANNATMARHELDEIMQERVNDSVRRAFPLFVADGHDEATRFAQEIGYGLDRLDDRPQVVVLVIADPPRKVRSNLTLFPERPTDNRLFALNNRIVNSGYPEYFTTSGFTSTRYGEDFCEIFQGAVHEDQHEYLWGNRIYLNGSSLRRTLAWQVNIHGAWQIEWLAQEIEASIRYALFALDEFVFQGVERLRILVGLKNLLSHPIARQSVVGWQNKLPKRRDDFVVLPERSSIVITRKDLDQEAKSIGQELSRIAGTLYD